MLKRLAILGLLALVGGAWSQVPGNGSSQHDNAQDKQKTANPPKPVVVVDSQHSANNQEQASEKPAKYPWGELLAPANIPNWFLVVVGGITGWFVYKTLRAIKKQADIMETQAKDARESGVEATKIALATAQAAQKTADATAAQIEIVKSKERAHLRIEFADFDFEFDSGGYPVRFTVTLDGTTRAYILSEAIIAYTSGLPPEKRSVRKQIGLPRNFTPETSPIETYTLIQTDDGFPEVETDVTKIWAVRENRLFLFVSGYILYRDIFGDSWRLEFSYTWKNWSSLGGDTKAAGGMWSGADMHGGYRHSKVEEHPTNHD
jgi:hypothetical protein